MPNEFPEATARPWQQFDQDANATEIMGADGPTVCTMEQRGGVREINEALDNARLIVTAVNSYDALRAAIQSEIHRQCTHCKNGLNWTDDGRAHYGYEHQGVVGIVTCSASSQLRAALHPQPEQGGKLK